MSQPGNGDWMSSPWLGEHASSNLALWQAECEWAAMSNWFSANAILPFAPVDAEHAKKLIEDSEQKSQVALDDL